MVEHSPKSSQAMKEPPHFTSPLVNTLHTISHRGTVEERPRASVLAEAVTRTLFSSPLFSLPAPFTELLLREDL